MRGAAYPYLEILPENVDIDNNGVITIPINGVSLKSISEAINMKLKFNSEFNGKITVGMQDLKVNSGYITPPAIKLKIDESITDKKAFYQSLRHMLATRKKKEHINYLLKLNDSTPWIDQEHTYKTVEFDNKVERNSFFTNFNQYIKSHSKEDPSYQHVKLKKTSHTQLLVHFDHPTIEERDNFYTKTLIARFIDKRRFSKAKENNVLNNNNNNFQDQDDVPQIQGNLSSSSTSKRKHFSLYRGSDISLVHPEDTEIRQHSKIRNFGQ